MNHESPIGRRRKKKEKKREDEVDKAP